MLIGLGLMVWLVVSMLTMGVICFIAAGVFSLFPNRTTHHLMWFWYIHWTMMLGWWVKKLLPGIKVTHRDPIVQSQPYVIVANHYSWIDIVILYTTIFTSKQSFVFVMKRSLIKLPMIGIVCWGLGHPLLYRGKARRKNIEILTKGALKSREYQHGILVFPEGTRYTKAASYSEEYQSVLKPHTMGFECVMKSIGDVVPVLDVTLSYSDAGHGVWDFLCGNVGSISVYTELHQVESQKAKEWLLSTWSKKDHWLTSKQFPNEANG